jgi:hypothetical protein
MQSAKPRHRKTLQDKPPAFFHKNQQGIQQMERNPQRTRDLTATSTTTNAVFI